jgi:hypothetical protein
MNSVKSRLSGICKHDPESDNKIHSLELAEMIWIVARRRFLNELFMFIMDYLELVSMIWRVIVLICWNW